ncbi:BatA domain-containing protein [Pontibacter silvestris]|uniref:BatA domain-containing protein n=1 Tax=Pontibacter silvestris TaxID=2305183 RepID=A0ABW4X0Y5_9BACT|nr:BatA domain-containing protein [Pontibacter silvestris]MCC9135795.1 BatA domain-containing protein [Pontibacter silvestris]
MTFLYPYWLLAASAILVPIAIHLWNKRQGKTVKVGSLRWLEASASKRWSSIKLNDVGLLLLRCLIFILLAIALAQPIWTGTPKEATGRKAVYVSPELLYSSSLASIKPTIDSLLQHGYNLYSYTSHFEPVVQEQWQQINSSSKDSVVQAKGNYWSLLPALAQRYPQAQDSVWLFTSDLQRYFRGRKTALAQNIRWIPVAIENKTTWLQAANQLSEDSLQLIIGNSNREGTTFTRYRTSSSATSVALVNGKQIQLQRQGDTLLATLDNQPQGKVKLQREPLQVVLYSEEKLQPELRYLQAALQAISSYTGQPLNLINNPTATDTTTASWVFWLHQQEVPEQLLAQVKQGAKLWVQQGAKPKVIKTILPTEATAIQVNQLTSDSTTTAFTSVWETTTGEPLLTTQQLGKGSVYHFQSGFSPEWSDLGQNSQLPELLLPVLFKQEQAIAMDARALDEQQLRPTKRITVAGSEPEAQRYQLLPWVVLAAFLLFLAERLIANKRAKV